MCPCKPLKCHNTINAMNLFSVNAIGGVPTNKELSKSDVMFVYKAHKFKRLIGILV